jgi:hypothetical protein
MSLGWPDFVQKIIADYRADQLVLDNASVLAPSKVYSPGSSLGYAGLLVTTSQPAAATLTCQAVEATGVLPPFGRQMPLLTAGGTVSWIIPLPLNPVVGYEVELSSSPSQSSAGTTAILGLSSLPIPVRPDGRAYPVGAFTASLTANGYNTEQTILPNTSPPFRYLLQSLSAVLTGQGQLLYVTIGGQVVTLASNVINNTVVIDREPAGGILLDPGTGIVLLPASNSSGAAVSVVYDLVF